MASATRSGPPSSGCPSAPLAKTMTSSTLWSATQPSPCGPRLGSRVISEGGEARRQLVVQELRTLVDREVRVDRHVERQVARERPVGPEDRNLERAGHRRWIALPLAQLPVELAAVVDGEAHQQPTV